MARSLNRDIADELRQQIADGRLKAGDRLTQAQLAETYGVSRMTVREVVNQLGQEGLIDVHAGRYGGIFVRHRATLTHYASHGGQAGYRESDLYTKEVEAQGYEPTQKLEVTRLKLPAEIAERLQSPAARGVRRRSIRSVNGTRSSIADSYFPAALATAVPEIARDENVKEGTTELLKSRGWTVAANKDEISARPPTPAEAELLGLGRGTPVLITCRTAYAESGPIRVTVTTWAADRNQIVYVVGDADVVERVGT